MAKAAWNRTIVDASGNVLPGADITVTDERTGTLATLFDDREGNDAKSNPFVADTNGFASFFAEPGVYRVVAESGALSRTWRFQSLLDNALPITWTDEQTFTDKVTMTDELEVDGDLEVTGDVEIGGNADITGNTDIDGNLEIDGNFEVTGSAKVDGNDILTVASDLQGLTGAGKILQIVRATDSTNRQTTSTSFVDVTGMAVTITPQKSNSVILVIASFTAVPVRFDVGDLEQQVIITDSSNNILSGTASFGGLNIITTSGLASATFQAGAILIGHVTPGVTTSVTYKLRHRIVSGSTSQISNSAQTGQMYAIEVAV